MVLASVAQVSAQENNELTQKSSDNTFATPQKETRLIYPRKGSFFGYWGYNCSAYTTSDIHVWGDGYDFTVTNVRATDEQTPFGVTYVKPTAFTAPQYNYRIGYFIDDKSFVAIGSDHMKNTIAHQTTHMSGVINVTHNKTDVSDANKGTYSNSEIVVGENSEGVNPGLSIIDSTLPHGIVSNFEHCDGLNDVSFEYGRLEQLWMSNNGKHALAVVGTVGVGMVVPDTDADILGQPPKHDMEVSGKIAYHLAGYSLSSSIGIQFDFCKKFFLLGRIKAGYINLPDINTTDYGGKASQHFDFIESMMVFGYTHKFSSHKKK